MTVREALRNAVLRLQKAGLRHPRDDAEAILTAVLGQNRAFLLAHPDRSLTPEARRRLARWLGRRERHFPIQYLRGRQEFFGRDFVVNPSVLVPRPETELLVECSLKLLAQRHGSKLTAAEVGIGSGCLGLSLVCEEPRLNLAATEISPAAIEVAALNARRLSCEERVEIVAGDVLAPLADRGPVFDLIVANPPYGSLLQEDAVDLGVRRYEPRKAVFAGATGLEVFQGIFGQAGSVLRRDGRIAVEIGFGQRKPVEQLASASGWTLVEAHRDLAGIERSLVFCAA